MFNLEKFAKQVIPEDPEDANRKLTESIEKLNDTVAEMQKKIEEIKPKEPEPAEPPKEEETTGPAEVE